MDTSFHRFVARQHLPRLSLLVAWLIAVLLVIAGFGFWILPAF